MTFLSWWMDIVSLKHICECLPLEKRLAFHGLMLTTPECACNRETFFFLYLQQLTFYSLLEKNKNLSFTSLSITNKMEQSSLAEMHLPREYGRVSQHLFPAVFLSLAFNFNNYLPVPLLSFPLLRYFVLLLWLSVLFCLKCFRICYHGYRCQNWK